VAERDTAGLVSRQLSQWVSGRRAPSPCKIAPNAALCACLDDGLVPEYATDSLVMGAAGSICALRGYGDRPGNGPFTL